MSLLCGKNPALDAVNAVKDAIKAKLSDKKSALGGLASQAAALKSKLGELKATIPTLDSFQAELAGLAGATPAQVAAFKEKWNGKVAQLDSFIAKATSGIANALDFCKDVPNVKMDPATGATVSEAKEAQTPSSNPPSAEAVSPTVTVYSSQPTSGRSTGTQKDMLKYLEIIREGISIPITRPITKATNSELQALNTLLETAEFKALLKKIKDAGGSEYTFQEAADSGVLSADDVNTYSTKFAPTVERYRMLAAYSSKVNSYELNKIQSVATGFPTEEEVTKSAQEFIDKMEHNWTVVKIPKGPINGITLDLKSDFAKIDAVIDGNKDTITKGYLYLHNKQA